MDRDTRERARATDAEPGEQLELARRHLRGGDSESALALLDLHELEGLEAHVLRARAEAARGRWRSAARAIRLARRAGPESLPHGLAQEVAEGLCVLDDRLPEPGAPKVPPGQSALAEEVEAAERRRERAWLLSWLGSSSETLSELTDEAPLLAGHPDLASGFLDHADPLASARAMEGLALREGAAALARLAPPESPLHLPQALALAGFAACAPALVDHRAPLVRHVARGAPRLVAFPREPIPTRLFSAHGQDFQTGTFLSAPVLDASTEARLRLLTPETLDLLDLLCGRAFPWRVRGRGYGLALPSSAPRGELQERVRLVNLSELLPLQLRLGQGHMFDVMSGLKEEETEDPLAESLARYLAADLCRHPARIEAGPNLVYARLLATFPPAKRSEAEPRVHPTALLSEAAEVYSPVGLAALEQFVEWEGHPPRRSARRDPYRT